MVKLPERSDIVGWYEGWGMKSEGGWGGSRGMKREGGWGGSWGMKREGGGEGVGVNLPEKSDLVGPGPAPQLFAENT